MRHGTRGRAAVRSVRLRRRSMLRFRSCRAETNATSPTSSTGSPRWWNVGAIGWWLPRCGHERLQLSIGWLGRECEGIAVQTEIGGMANGETVPHQDDRVFPTGIAVRVCVGLPGTAKMEPEDPIADHDPIIGVPLDGQNRHRSAERLRLVSPPVASIRVFEPIVRDPNPCLSHAVDLGKVYGPDDLDAHIDR